jgi:Pvc16 N-terminal domain
MPLSTLESTLKTWLQEELPLPEDEGDVSFDSPDGTWGASITRPTLNLFLFDIGRAAVQPTLSKPYRDEGGTVVRDRPAPAVSFSYLVSAWGGGVREEHRLLGDAVRGLLRTPVLEAGPAGGEIAGHVHLALADPERTRGRELWGGLGGRLRPSLVVVATAAVSLDRPVRVAPPVRRVGTAVAPVRASEDPADDGRRFVWFGASRQRHRDRA